MNLKKLLIFMLVGIVCSVSAVSAADINDTVVEIESHDATMGVDELSNDMINIQKMDNANGTVMAPEELDNLNSDGIAFKQNNTTSNDVKIIDCIKADCANAQINGLHFNLNANTAKDTQGSLVAIGSAGIFDLLTTAVKLGINICRQQSENIVKNADKMHPLVSTTLIGFFN